MPEVEQLVKSARDGNNEAFVELVQLFERTVRVSAFSITGDYQAAEDVTQETFLIAHRKLGELRSTNALASWLLQICRREAVRNRKKRVALLPLGDASELEDSRPSVSPRQEALLEAVGKLPEHERIVVVLHYLDGGSAREVSRITGRSVGTVTKQLSRAVKRLKQFLSVQLID